MKQAFFNLRYMENISMMNDGVFIGSYTNISNDDIQIEVNNYYNDCQILIKGVSIWCTQFLIRNIETNEIKEHLKVVGKDFVEVKEE